MTNPAATGDPLDTPIEALDLSIRAYNCLKRSGLLTIRQLLPLREDGFLKLRNFGRKSYDEVMEKLAERGFGGSWPGPRPDDRNAPGGPDTSGDRSPRRPLPSASGAAAEAVPERDGISVDVRSAG